MSQRFTNDEIAVRHAGVRHYLRLAVLLLVASTLAIWCDLSVARWETSHRLPGDLNRIIRLTEIFAHGFGVFVVAVGVWSLAPHFRRFVPRLVCCAMLPALAAALIKLLVFRKRPAAYMNAAREKIYPNQIADTLDANGSFPAAEFLGNSHGSVEYMFQSFPSAHAATAVGLAVGLTWLFPKGRSLFILLAIMASIQRISASSHWTSDVFAGATLGVLLGGAMTCNWGLGYLLGKYEQRYEIEPVPPEGSCEVKRAA